jgi:phosphatidylglycerol lysyltransferase
MGVDTWLPLASYDFAGKEKEPFRYASNWLRRRGYTIGEASFADVPPADVADLSTRWRQTRTIKDREVGLLNRPLVLEDEPGVRKFFLRDSKERLVAFIYLDPVYRDGRTIGYATSIKRRDPEAPVYAEQGISRHCVDQLKAEGVDTLRLGLSPLAGLADRSFRHNPLMHAGWRYGFGAWWVNRWFYNLKGHAAFKRRFRGEEYPVYFASPTLLSDLRIIAMLRLMRVF